MPRMSEISKKRIRNIIKFRMSGMERTREIFYTEYQSALSEFENLLKCENIVHRLLKAKVRGDSSADLFELIEGLMIQSESVIGLPSEDEAYEQD